jgi:hypothetical protein
MLGFPKSRATISKTLHAKPGHTKTRAVTTGPTHIPAILYAPEKLDEANLLSRALCEVPIKSLCSQQK